MKRIKITVTKRDIELGKRKDECACPVARAIRRVKGFETATIGAAGCHTVDDYFDLPLEISRFILAFDNGKPVRPITFTLQIP